MAQPVDLNGGEVALLGWYGSPNVGDEAELASILGQLATLPHPPRATVFSIDTTATRRRFAAYPGGLLVLRRSPLSPRALLALRRAGLLILGGGGLIQDQTSVYNLPIFTLFALAARLCGAGIMWWGVGAEPIVTAFGRWQARRLVAWSRPGAVSVRDQESLEILAQAGVPRRSLRVTVDPALTLQPDEFGRADRLLYETLRAQGGGAFSMDGGAPLVIFCLRDLPNNPRGRGPAYLLPVSLQKKLRRGEKGGQDHEQESAAFHAALAAAADYLIESRGARILFVPFWAGRDDLIAGQVRKLMRNARGTAVINRYVEPRLARALIGRAALVISVRLHPLVFAAAAGVPAIGFTYARKIEGFLSHIGVPGQALPAAGLQADSLRSAIGELMESWGARRGDVGRAVEALRALATFDLATCAIELSRRKR